MYPVGNIIRKEGETIEINCTLDSPDHTIKDLKFSFDKRSIKPEILVSNTLLFICAMNLVFHLNLFIFIISK